MTIRHHLDTGELIKAQQEKIARLQAELHFHRSNLNNGYGDGTATDAEIAQSIIRAYPSRFGGIACALISQSTSLEVDHDCISPF